MYCTADAHCVRSYLKIYYSAVLFSNKISLLLVAWIAKRLRIVQRVFATFAFGENMIEREHDTVVRIQVEMPRAFIFTQLRALYCKMGPRFTAASAHWPVCVENPHSKAGHAAADRRSFHGHAFLFLRHGRKNIVSRKSGVTLVSHTGNCTIGPISFQLEKTTVFP